MSTVTLYTRVKGLKEDRALHAPILSAAEFNKSPAFKFSLKRIMALGLSEEQAKKVLLPPKPQD